MKKSRILLCLLMILEAGCTRVPHHIPYETHLIKFNTNSKDSTLEIPDQESLHVSPDAGTVDSSVYFENLEVMQKLAEDTPATDWIEKSQTHLYDFYQEPSSHSEVKFSDAPYADFFIAKSKSDFMQATQNLPQFFTTQKQLVHQAIEDTKKDFPFPTQNISILEVLNLITVFIKKFETDLQTLNVDSTVRLAIQDGINKQFLANFSNADHIAEQLENAPDLTGAVSMLRQLLSTLKIDISQSNEAQLDNAADIGEKLKTNMNASSAFSFMIDLWNNMSPQDRATTFGEASPELFKFLNSNNPRELDCLKDPSCLNMLTRFKKDYLVLPKLKAYGVEKLQNQIEQSAMDKLKSETSDMATQLIKDLPSMLESKIDDEIDEQAKRFQGYRDNYSGFVKTELQNWFQNQFLQKTLPALESSRIVLESSKDEDVVLNQNSAQDAFTEVSSDALGSALSASYYVFSNPQAEAFKDDSMNLQLLALTRVNQLLAYGGFSLADGGSFPALDRTFQGTGDPKPLNIEATLNLPNLFVMPSPYRVKSGFQVPVDIVAAKLDIESQARLLHGFTSMVYLFNDWDTSNPNPMNAILGQIQAKDLMPDLPSEALNVTAFPTDGFLALSVGNAAAVLKNLQAKGSPLFVMCQDHSVVWEDQNIDCPHPSALAGLVNIEKGKRLNTVDLRAQAEFLQSLIEFLNLIDNLKGSHSPYLLKKDDSGVSALDQLINTQPKLRSLALGVTNFITSILQSENGDFYSGYDLTLKAPMPIPADINAQLKAILAVVNAAHYFQFKGYDISALDAYYALNRTHWNTKIGFYHTPSENLKVSDLALAIKCLGPLLNVPQDVSSLEQLTNMIDTWKQVLRKHSY